MLDPREETAIAEHFGVPAHRCAETTSSPTYSRSSATSWPTRSSSLAAPHFLVPTLPTDASPKTSISSPAAAVPAQPMRSNPLWCVRFPARIPGSVLATRTHHGACRNTCRTCRARQRDRAYPTPEPTGNAPWPTERRLLVQRYSDAAPAALSVPTAPAFAAWKTTAWAHRATSRDLYDLWLLARPRRHHCRSR